MNEPRTTIEPGWVPMDSGRIAGWRSTLLSGHASLVHAFTSPGVNMSWHRDPQRDADFHRHRALCGELGLPFHRLTIAEQVHESNVAVIDEAHFGGKTSAHLRIIPKVDGLVTALPDTPLMGLTADCPLILLFDPRRRALGIAHAGWRGTVAGLASRLVSTMTAHFRSDPSEMLASIAPSAGPCCYEVGSEVVDLGKAGGHVSDRHVIHRQGRTHLDLWTANADQLRSAGLSNNRIERPTLCTICDTRFFSYRRLGANTGHSALLAALR